nr:uncharacterized protein LOC129524220 isoform X2 [Gorilla gorilla gorilla]
MFHVSLQCIKANCAPTTLGTCHQNLQGCVTDSKCIITVRVWLRNNAALSTNSLWAHKQVLVYRKRKSGSLATYIDEMSHTKCIIDQLPDSSKSKDAETEAPRAEVTPKSPSPNAGL